MEYVFIQPLSMASLFILFIAFLVFLVYFTYLFIKRIKISNLKKMSTALIVGFPNSGKSFIVKELCKSKEGVFDKMLNISYADLMHDGMVKLKILDHQGIFSTDGKVDHGIIDDIKTINPKYTINIIDVSPFSEPIENQIDLINKVNKKFKGKKSFLVANKVSKKSGRRLKKIEENFGKKFYKIRVDKPEDTKKLREDLLRFLKMN